MILYGFELEGFRVDHPGLSPLLPVVEEKAPIDDFGGLIELRTSGGKTLEAAYAEIIQGYAELHKNTNVDFTRNFWKFSAQEHAALRKRGTFMKRSIDVRNLYNKPARDAKGWTLASLQINISNQILPAQKLFLSNTGEYRVTPHYGLLDVGGIIRRLDVEFAKEIKESKRQPGMYAIKDGIRLEYRSLPNFVFPFDQSKVKTFLSRVKNAVENAHA